MILLISGTSIIILYNLFSQFVIRDADISIMANGFVICSVFYGLYVSIERKASKPKLLRGISRFIHCFFASQCLGYILVMLTHPILMQFNSLGVIIFSGFLVLLALGTLFISTGDLKHGKFSGLD